MVPGDALLDFKALARLTGVRSAEIVPRRATKARVGPIARDRTGSAALSKKN